VARIVVGPKEGRLVASTESPLTTIVGPALGPAARAGGLTVADAMSATAAGAIRGEKVRRRGGRAD
jgi:hypothetical protein